MSALDFVVRVFIPALTLALAIWQFFRSKSSDLEAQLKDPVDRAQLREELLSKDPARAYWSAVDRYFLAPLQKGFGAPLSWQAFERCLTLAFIYPIIGLYVAWTFGANCSFGSGACPLPVELPEGWQRWPRGLTLLAAFLIAGIAGYFIALKSDLISKRIMRLLPQSFGDFVEVLTPIAFLLIANKLILELFIAPAFPFGSGVVAGGLIATTIGLLAGASFVHRIYLYVLLAVSVAYPLRGWLVDNHGLTVIGFVFGLALPLVNAVIDWLSLAFTRFLVSRHAANPSGASALAGGLLRILADCLVALATLVALVALTTIIIEVFNELFILKVAGREPIDIWYLIGLARSDPLGHGLLVTLTLVTTFIPTIAHIVVGVTGVAFSLSPQSRQAGALIPQSDEEHFSAASLQKVRDTLVWRRIWIAPALLVALCVVGGFIWLVGQVAQPIGLLLSDVAYCSTQWIHGLCPAPPSGPFPKITPFSVDP